MRINFLYIYSLLFFTLAFVSYTQEITVNLVQLTNTLQQLSSYLLITTSPSDKQAEDSLKSLQDILADIERTASTNTIELFISRASAINQNIQIINTSYISLSTQFQTTIKQFFNNFNAQLATLLLKGFKGLKLDQESVTEVYPWAIGDYNRASWDTFISALAAYRVMQNQYIVYLSDKNITMPILEDPILHSIISTFHKWIGTSFLQNLRFIGNSIFENYRLNYPNVAILSKSEVNSIIKQVPLRLDSIIKHIQTLLDTVLRIKPYIKLNTKVFAFELQWLAWLANMNISFDDLLLNSSYKESLDRLNWPTTFSVLPSLQLGIPFSNDFQNMFGQAFHRFIKVIPLIRPDQVANLGIFDNLAARTEYEKFSSRQFEKYSEAYHFFRESDSEENENLYDLLFNSSKNTPVQFVNNVTQLDRDSFEELNTMIQGFFNRMRPRIAEALQEIKKQT